MTTLCLAVWADWRLVDGIPAAARALTRSLDLAAAHRQECRVSQVSTIAGNSCSSTSIATACWPADVGEQVDLLDYGASVCDPPAGEVALPLSARVSDTRNPTGV
jgi:hypothetical protein